MSIDKIDLTNAKVLIVDDVPANLNVLYNALESEGYKILAAPNGEVALKNAQRTIPELILLDIMMPGIDGFEACRRLKADESTADIPIIFITARSETESIVEGFQIGGVDYIIKPFQHEEVRARVRTHLMIKRLQDELRESNDRLRESNDRLREANTQIEAQKKAVEQELQDAHQMQMSLMPDTAPLIEGLEIAGKCLPANTVSGDFFDYLTGQTQNEITLVVADVTGKAMKGAMNAVMTDGILRTAAIEQGQFTPASLMTTLNNILKDRLERYMNVTMVIGTIDTDAMTLTLANAAHHAYPLLLRRSQTFLEGKGFERENPRLSLHGEIQTLKTGGMPLGMKACVQYTEEQFPLQSGDTMIFMTDGIIEARNSEEQQYSDSGRLEETILQFTPEQSAESMVEAILNDAIDFGSDKLARDANPNDVLISPLSFRRNSALATETNPNGNQNKNGRLRLTDDMTVVVAKVL